MSARERALFAGATDYTGVPIEDVLSHLREWRDDTAQCIGDLLRYEKEVETHRRELHSPDDVLAHIKFFVDLLERYAADFERLVTEMPESVTEAHVEIVRQIYDSSVQARDRGTRFAADQVEAGVKDEAVRWLVDGIYQQSAGMLADYGDLSNLVPRLRTFIGVQFKVEVEGAVMGTCFVVQPFDGGRFDKRYEDVFAPAIQAAGLEPYRVDRDPAVSVPIDDIQAGIEASDVVLADVTTDNPNVWFELGYAIAAQRDVVLVCSDEREMKFPFDVQHRNIVRYSTDSSSDFDSLRRNIESRIEATLKRSVSMGRVAGIHSVASVEGLQQHHVATLVAVAEESDDPTSGVSTYQIRASMERAGFTKLATTLGLKALSDMKMLESFDEENYSGDRFLAYRVTDAGMAWLAANQDILTLFRPPSARVSAPARTPGPEDDIPF